MNTNRFFAFGRIGTAALSGFLALAAGPAGATEVYRWVDADGVVHFSQTAPAGAVEDVSRQVVENPVPSGYDPDEDIYDVAGQQERMQARREALERDLEARRERERQAAQQPMRSAPPVQGYPVYGWPGYRPRPPQRPRPPIEPPIEPPTRPPATLKPPGSDGS
ncbi:MAG: DUF4124 domain-containing protein [Xanthomonadales bacterium]